jgi:hypothetical protein
MSPRFALWPSGRILWRVGVSRYYEGHIAAAKVKQLLSSVRIDDYNNRGTMRYSYAGYDLCDEHYTVLFLSKGREQNVILCSPFHHWWKRGGEPTLVYRYWDESSLFGVSFPTSNYSWPEAGNEATKTYSWSEFTKIVPKRFLAYLNTWESLEGKLLQLVPDVEHSRQMNPRGTIILIAYVYEYRDGNSPRWVQVEDKGPSVSKDMPTSFGRSRAVEIPKNQETDKTREAGKKEGTQGVKEEEGERREEARGDSHQDHAKPAR